jgi:phosphoglycolate phosphatase
MRDLTLVFDLDGTLVDTAPDLIHATNHALAGLGHAPVGAATVRPWISYGARRMIVEALSAVGDIRSDGEVDDALERFLDYYAANIAVDSRPFSGTVAALDRFAACGARLAVCTNKREALSRLLLDQLGMTTRFASLAGRDTFPVSKPHPDHLLGAIKLAGGDAGRAVMVGDSDVDIATAKAAGVPVVAVTFGYTHAPVGDFQPDAVIDHYDDLDAAVTRVLAGRSSSQAV